MKRFYRVGLQFLLALGCVLVLLLPLRAQTELPPVDSPSPISALRLDPQRLRAYLDADNIPAAINQLEQGWRLQLNEYYGRHFRTELLPPDQIAESLRQNAQLTGQRSALIYAVSIPDQLDVMVLLPDGQLLHHRVADATPEVVAASIRQLRMELSDLRSFPRDYLPPAQQLYAWLLAPIAPTLEAQGIEQLIFCLGGKLRGVPMAALHDGQRFLPERYSVAIIPAFNLLDRRPPDLEDVQILAMGASEFQTQAPLPAVPAELAAIRQLWPSEVELNQAFTVENLRQQRSRQPFSIIHLATHADFAPGAAQDSYIQFWNRRLRLTQLREMDLQTPPVELLVLSACRTAVGDTQAELGFAGLAVQSGAKAALASLWAISDAGTVFFMTGFYQALKVAPTKGEALRQTQLAMLEGRLNLESPTVQAALQGIAIPDTVRNLSPGGLTHPYYWSGFTLIGNPW